MEIRKIKCHIGLPELQLRKPRNELVSVLQELEDSIENKNGDQ
jgi:hypothetical protein